MMIYIPIDSMSPISTKKTVTIQKGLTNNFPEIVFEIHHFCHYFDLGDECQLSAAVTNTDLESVKFTGELSIMNPHRGQIMCRLNYEDFSMTGLNTLTVKCTMPHRTIAFQILVFVESVNEGILEALGK